MSDEQINSGVEVKKLLQRASNALADFEPFETSEERKSPTMEAAYRLIQTYVDGHRYMSRKTSYENWSAQTFGCGFFDAGASRRLHKANEFREQIEDGASASELYSVALDIIRAYETYCSQRAARKAEIDKHIKAQRRIIDSKRVKFLLALAERDGLFCQACSVTENLVIDHKKPLINGGFSVLENLQLLCNFCNRSKGVRDMDYLEHINKSRNLTKH